MTSTPPASDDGRAIPQMVPSAAQRLAQCCVHGKLWASDVNWLLERAYRDGWIAAQFALAVPITGIDALDFRPTEDVSRDEAVADESNRTRRPGTFRPFAHLQCAHGVWADAWCSYCFELEYPTAEAREHELAQRMAVKADQVAISR